MYSSEPDKGQSDAINKGLRAASGEIVSWINSNDIYLPGSLQTVGEYFASHPDVDVIFGKAKLIDVRDQVVGDYQEVGPIEATAPMMHALNSDRFGHFDHILNDHPGWIPQQTAFWRTSLMRMVGYLDVNLHYAMDYEYWLRLGQEGKIHFIDEYLGAFRLHSDAKSTNARQHWKEVLRVNRRYHGNLFSPLHGRFLRLVVAGAMRRLRLFSLNRFLVGNQ